MLHLITSISDSLLEYIKDDPVRPELSKEFRVGKNKTIAVHLEHNSPCSIVCISFHDFIPSTVDDLSIDSENPNTAIFYTIWSYVPGTAALLLREVLDNLKQTKPDIKHFLTLSPKTEMAKKFHLKNGANIYRENESTVNYQYLRLA